MLQLSAAVASLTLVIVLDVEGLLGLGPAIVLGSGALAALPAGRAMDRFGRVPVLAAGYLTGAAGCGLAALGSASELAPAVLGGLDARGRGERRGAPVTHRGRRHVPARAARPRDRARPLRRGVRRDPRARRVQPAARRQATSTARRSRRSGSRRGPSCWWAARSCRRCGPTRAGSPSCSSTSRSGTRTLRRPRCASCSSRPGVIPALIAAQASFAVMVGVMTLTGAVVVDHHGHEGHDVFPIIGAHVIGMYALVIVIGDLIDRIGRTPSLAGGLFVMAVSVISLLWVESVRGHGRRPVRPGPRLEPLVRGGDRRARRPHAALRARQAARLQRPALGRDRSRARAARRARAVGARRGGARDRRHRCSWWARRSGSCATGCRSRSRIRRRRCDEALSRHVRCGAKPVGWSKH